MASRTQQLGITALALLCFAGNSLLCRLALKTTTIDPASFTLVRLLSGALVLNLLVWYRDGRAGLGQGHWRSAWALFLYAAAFSGAYLQLSAATGALLLFGAVQVSMLSYGFWRGERFTLRQSLGFMTALAGLLDLLLPGLETPPLWACAAMILAGMAWAAYTLLGKQAGGDPTQVTAGNFARASLLGVLLSLLMGLTQGVTPWHSPLDGMLDAVASGALASGCGYALWYMALRQLKATTAATLQLSVPVLAALGGVVLLGEALSEQLVYCGLAVLGGIGLVIAW
jgi:drug/metabolite transporter (DMT)-like permease